MFLAVSSILGASLGCECERRIPTLRHLSLDGKSESASSKIDFSSCSSLVFIALRITSGSIDSNFTPVPAAKLLKLPDGLAPTIISADSTWVGLPMLRSARQREEAT